MAFAIMRSGYHRAYPHISAGLILTDEDLKLPPQQAAHIAPYVPKRPLTFPTLEKAERFRSWTAGMDPIGTYHVIRYGADNG